MTIERRYLFGLWVACIALAASACGTNSSTGNQNQNNNNTPPVCGDEVVDTGEECDDGTANSDSNVDACRTDCRLPYCGDRVNDTGEDCDDGDDGSNGEDDCPNDCVAPVCGDGHKWAGMEECDDGNTQSGDGCRGDCLQDETLCGGGVLDPGESCDGGELDGEDCVTQGFDGGVLQCAPDCTFNTANCGNATCGDSFVEFGEGCDDNNLTGGDGCDATCNVETGWSCVGEPSICTPGCGDGLVLGSEGCDDGNAIDLDGCTASCQVEAGWACGGEPSVCLTTCGDGIRVGTEGCDDGNTVAGDGCDAACAVEAGWTCSGLTPDICAPICGDGLLRGSEQCDDGGLVAGDGCSGFCSIETGWTCGGTPSTCSCATFYDGPGCGLCRVLVDLDPSITTRNGADWGTAFATVQEGLDAAEQLSTPCDVWVAQGTYPIFQGNFNDTVQLRGQVSVYGGFASTESQRDQRDWVANLTVLDGLFQVGHVVTGEHQALIDGFTITRGAATPVGGGGMHIGSVSTTVRNCIFDNNFAGMGTGGAIYMQGSSVPPSVIDRCIFTNNWADIGGAIWLWGSASVIITNSLFAGNTAANRGGAVAADTSTVTMTNCTVADNVAGNDTGGLSFSFNAAPTITNSIVWGNTAPADPNLIIIGTGVVTHSDIQGGYAGAGNLDLDPLFVGGGDYHLQSGSPCIDMADDAAAPATDLEGLTRVSQGGPFVADMGAFEYGGGVVSNLCQPAPAMTCGALLSGTNVGQPANFTSYPCGFGTVTGPEAYYRFDAAAAATVTVDLTGLSADLDLIVVGSTAGACDEQTQCLGSSQSGGPSDESVTFSAIAGGTYYFIVDGWNGATSSFDIGANCI